MKKRRKGKETTGARSEYLQAPRLTGSREGSAVVASDATAAAGGELHLSAQPRAFLTMRARGYLMAWAARMDSWI
uniref:Uncharacterized protein n=1 Tax=Oryza sativa subsp. japonica TaxID=39947 RepID=Q6ZHB4_ORYSJ|nr:hypothetical protein [Oryza sativa Japonica Group]